MASRRRLRTGRRWRNRLHAVAGRAAKNILRGFSPASDGVESPGNTGAGNEMRETSLEVTAVRIRMLTTTEKGKPRLRAWSFVLGVALWTLPATVSVLVA